MVSLDNLKVKLQISDNEQDLLLTTLLDDSTKLIMVYLGVNEFPDDLSFIAEDIAVKKYRKLGNEGVQTEKIDVLSTTYERESEYLSAYTFILDDYKKNLKGHNKLRLL